MAALTDNLEETHDLVVVVVWTLYPAKEGIGHSIQNSRIPFMCIGVTTGHKNVISKATFGPCSYLKQTPRGIDVYEPTLHRYVSISVNVNQGPVVK